MSWTSLGVVSMSPGWEFSAPTDGTYFRVRSTVSPDPPFLFKGLIAQGANGNPPLVTTVQRLWAVEDQATVFELFRPDWLSSPRSIALKRVGNFKTGVIWTARLDVWIP